MKFYIIYWFALITALTAGCNHTPKHVEENIATETTIVSVDTSAFFSLFAELKPDSVYLFTGYDSLFKSNVFLRGKYIPQSYSGLLQHTKSCNDHSLFNSNIDSSFAIGKFNSGTHTAFLIRHPGYYDASSISLFFLNKTTNKIDPLVYWLAESFGDAGDYFAMQTQLKKSDNGNHLLTISKQQNHPIERNSFKYMNTDSTLNYKLENASVVLLSAKEDTSWVNELIP